MNLGLGRCPRADIRFPRPPKRWGWLHGGGESLRPNRVSLRSWTTPPEPQTSLTNLTHPSPPSQGAPPPRRRGGGGHTPPEPRNRFPRRRGGVGPIPSGDGARRAGVWGSRPSPPSPGNSGKPSAVPCPRFRVPVVRGGSLRSPEEGPTASSCPPPPPPSPPPPLPPGMGGGPRAVPSLPPPSGAEGLAGEGGDAARKGGRWPPSPPSSPPT
jgi:hypothetical protein